MQIRLPHNAGSWYEGSEKTLKIQLTDECFLHKLGPSKELQLNDGGSRSIVGLICPHAGYVYSGPIAAHSYHALASDGKPENIVIMGPNHTGLGSGVALWPEGGWKTPLGELKINSVLAKKIQKASEYIDLDEQAHLYEHSIELQLPFLQLIFGSDLSFVPISVMIQDFEVALDIGQAIADSTRGTDTLVIASTDMTHYESQIEAERKDRLVIEAIENLDEKKVFDTVEQNNVSMCGVGPVIATIVSAKTLGAKQGQLLKYATSGDITKDRSAVVGYCSMALTKT